MGLDDLVDLYEMIAPPLKFLGEWVMNLISFRKTDRILQNHRHDKNDYRREYHKHNH